MKMGFFVEEKALKRIVVVAFPRWIKIVFFLFTMLVSFLIFSTPILLGVADALVPSALLSAAISPSSRSFRSTISSQLAGYDFRHSLIDIPIVSIARSAVILCVYSWCDGPRLSRGPYLGVATACSAASLVFVSLKASYLFMNTAGGGGYSSRHSNSYSGENARAMEAALLVSSVVLAIGHVAVAYRTSCRERRKLLVYKIDMEAVSAYHKILQQARTK